MNRPGLLLLGGIAGLGLWIVLAFVLALPSGWVHLPLALGVCLIALAIIRTEPAAGAGVDTRGT